MLRSGGDAAHRSHHDMRLSGAAAAALSACLVGMVHAQFFQQMFQHGPFAARTQEAEAPNVGDASWFRARVKAGTSWSYAANCDQFLCRDTLACVPEPSACPCPFAEQKRCLIGDAAVCVQESDCRQVERFYNAGL